MVETRSYARKRSEAACFVNHFTNGRSAFLRSQNGLKHDSRRACFTNHFANGRSAFLRPQKRFEICPPARMFVNQFATGRSELLHPQNDQEPCQSARMPCKPIWVWHIHVPINKKFIRTAVGPPQAENLTIWDCLKHIFLCKNNVSGGFCVTKRDEIL